MKKFLFIASSLVLVCAAASARAQDAPAYTDEQLAFFETSIRPVLAEHCYSCHSHQSDPLKGGFYLDSRQGIIDDFLAEPGDPNDSMIIEAVRYADPDMQMPPTGKLPDEVIANLERWVEMGMPWPEEAAPGDGGGEFDLEARRASHWAWQAPELVADLPEVDGRDAATSVIDLLIESRLAEEGLSPGPLADRATLIRRVTLDLTGLPPTAQEVAAFVNDESPQAYERLVDRLLASPRYGEAWGRHWLDLVRYAESYGHEFDFNIPEAWRYRDYVIRALNDDVPYDRFVHEQIAGDLIEPRIHPETRVNEAVTATGWWFMHEQTHAPTDVRLHEADRVDNQIDVFSKTFLGVTVACARCHDHKFDAISAADYYAIAGYMQSSRQQIAYQDPGGTIALATGAVQDVVMQGQAAFAALDAPLIEPTTIEHDGSVLYESFNAGLSVGWASTGWAWGQTPTQPGHWDARSGSASPVLPGVMHSGLLGDQAVGTLRSPEFDIDQDKIWIRVNGSGQVRVIVDSFTVARYNALLFRGLDQNINTEGQWRWIAIQRDLVRYSGDGNHRGYLEFIDDKTDGHLIIDEVRFGDAGAPPNPQQDGAIASAAPQADANFAAITQRITEAAAQIPAPVRVLAIADGSGEDSYVHIRGSWHGYGPSVPRRNLSALGGDDMPALSEGDGSGRQLLARSITAPGNPLTARVQVNRIWHHLFGQGIVPTVDNFGYLGLPPSHPELLDHLAVLFVEDDGWSNKAMIRRIVLSDAYRRASDRTDAVAEERDPNNVLLHRQGIRRLTAEGIRDAMLFVSGSLNETPYGAPVSVHLTAFMQGRGRPGQGPLDGNGRRSIYISVRRNFLSPMMLTFDAPIPFSTVGRRNVSNVPAQALTLLNDPFVHDQAQRWSRRLVEDGSETVGQRVDAIFLSAFGRAATQVERDAASAFIAGQGEALGLSDEQLMSDQRPWRELCHTVFNLKGFIYVR